MRVWKYEFTSGTARDSFLMPVDATILHVAVQRGGICMWALVDPLRPKRFRTFEIAGTGYEVSDKAYPNHVGSCLTEGGDYVWHVFEIKEDDAS